MESKSSLSVPIAIVVAGLIIGGAVYFTSKNSSVETLTPPPTESQTSKIQSKMITINPVSTKDYIRGNPGAKVVVVEFSDTECPYCKVFHGTMKNLVDEKALSGTMAWVYRNFPIKELHSKAIKESEALLCAGKIGGQEAFWSFTDAVYAKTNSNNSLDAAQLPIIAKDVGIDVKAFNTCLSSGEMAASVEAEYQDAKKSGGTGTPFSVLITSTPFNKAEVEKFLTDSILSYRFPPELFTISTDNKKIGVSGAMPSKFMDDLITFLAK